MAVNDERPVLRSPAPERGGATIDEAVATAEAGSQVEGVHTPSGQAASGDSRVEHMVDEPVSQPRVEGEPGH